MIYLNSVFSRILNFYHIHLEEKLEKEGFKLIKRTDFEIVYDFAFVREESFDKWFLLILHCLLNVLCFQSN